MVQSLMEMGSVAIGKAVALSGCGELVGSKGA
jgi:hypothetical protein